jgi:hypothetical protein
MRIGHLLFATHPRRFTIRESTSEMASSSKGENGAGDVLPAPLDQLTRLTHKLLEDRQLPGLLLFLSFVVQPQNCLIENAGEHC